MAKQDSIQLYHGARSGLPALLENEPGYATDTRELFIGSGAGNVLLASGDAAGGTFPAVRLKEKTVSGSALNGMIFEDADGKLKYRNLAGVVYDLTYTP